MWGPIRQAQFSITSKNDDDDSEADSASSDNDDNEAAAINPTAISSSSAPAGHAEARAKIQKAHKKAQSRIASKP